MTDKVKINPGDDEHRNDRYSRRGPPETFAVFAAQLLPGTQLKVEPINGWGLWIAFRDPDGRLKELIVHSSRLATALRRRKLMGILANRGLLISPHYGGRFAKFLYDQMRQSPLSATAHRVVLGPLPGSRKGRRKQSIDSMF